MPTSAKQDNDFRDALISKNLLEEAIDWIKGNMKIDEVFDEKEILAYANNYDPEDVHTVSSLESWAESNGYIKQ